MNYNEVLKYLNNLSKFGIKLGLERMKNLLKKLENPEKNTKFIHVAGTNGKGSVCAMLSYILTECGYKTGLFISPFIINFRERIQVNNKFILEDEFAEISTKIFDIIKKNDYKITEFEFITTVAFEYFHKQKCDIVVLETGLGGRFDATNVIETPLISVLTSISEDHVKTLGNSIKEIAKEKCGIIKNNGTTVTIFSQEKEVLKIIKETCIKKNNNLIISKFNNFKILKQDFTGTEIIIKNVKYKIPLIGEYQVENFLLILNVLNELNKKKFVINNDNKVSGLKKVKHPARLEILNMQPLIILDGAHNISGIQKLADFIKKYLKNKKIHAIFSMMEDKDYKKSVKYFSNLFEKIIITKADNPRVCEPEKIAEEFKKYKINFEIINKSKSSLESFLNSCNPNDILIIFGSLYLASEIRSELIKIFN